MSNINLKDELLNALQNKPVSRVPVASVTQTGIVDLMDATGAAWPEAHSNPEMMVKLSYAGYEIAGLEGVRLPYCLTVLAEALGCEVNIGTKSRQPSIANHPLSKSIDGFALPENLLEIGRVPVILKAIEMMKEKVGDDLAIIAGFEGPVTLASDLVGVESFMMWFIKKPENVVQLIDLATDACIEYANALVDHGADVICVADPVASPDLVSPDMFDSIIKQRLTKLAENINGIKVLHICGNTTKILGSMAECKFDALSIEEKVKDIKAAKEVTKGQSLVGTVSAAVTMFRGTPDQVKEEARSCLSNGINVLAPGCGIAPTTPIANVKALVEARNEFYA